MNIRTHAIITVASWAALGLFLALTSPEQLPAVCFVVPFILLYIGLSRLIRLFVLLRSGEAEQEGESNRWKLRAGNAVSVWAVLLLILQSLGQLTWRDVLSLSLLFVIGYFYLIRMRREAPG